MEAARQAALFGYMLVPNQVKVTPTTAGGALSMQLTPSSRWSIATVCSCLRGCRLTHGC